MTLDKLAGMVARGFQAVDARFDGVEKRFDDVESRLDAVETSLGDIDARLSRTETNVIEVKQAVRRIDLRTQNQVDAVYSDITNLKKRVTVLEKRPA